MQVLLAPDATLNPMARPTKLTAEVLGTITRAIEAGCYATVAAEFAGISERTFYRWMAQGEAASTGPLRALYEGVNMAAVRAEMRAVAIIMKAAETDWRAAAWWLERRCFHEDWGLCRHVSISAAPVSHRLEATILDASNLTEEGLAVLERLLKELKAVQTSADGDGSAPFQDRIGTKTRRSGLDADRFRPTWATAGPCVAREKINTGTSLCPLDR